MTWGVWRSASGFGPQIGGVVDVPASSAYTANAVRFDGTNDCLVRGGGLTGAADSKMILISFWVKFMGGDGNTQRIVYPTGEPWDLRRETSNKVRFLAAGIADFQTVSTGFVASMSWTHVLIALDTATAAGHLYVNDASDYALTGSITDATLDHTPTDWTIGAQPGPSLFLDAEVADLYVAPGQYLDISNSTNRRKFISAGGKPVDLGSDGSTPTGVAPLIFLKNPFGTFHENEGTGGDFTVTGALTAAGSSPSD
jgi:hypothetical protein